MGQPGVPLRERLVALPSSSSRAMPRSPQGIGLRDVALTPVSRSWKPAGSVFWCGQDLGSIEGHYRALADSKHPFDRTSFGTPRTGMNDVETCLVGYRDRRFRTQFPSLSN